VLWFGNRAALFVSRTPGFVSVLRDIGGISEQIFAQCPVLPHLVLMYLFRGMGEPASIEGRSNKEFFRVDMRTGSVIR
jgi:hypothetical protein